jgi:hypothetical protein
MTKKVREFYELLLLAYPREFRQRFGSEMAMTFSDHVREQTDVSGIASAICLALWELLTVAAPLRLQNSMAIALLLSSAGSSALFFAVLRATARVCH